MNQPNLTRLKSQLNIAKVRETDFPLYQVVEQLIGAVKQLQDGFEGDLKTSLGPTGVVSSGRYLTHTNQTSQLPNSRQLLAGLNISFDDSISGERTINFLGNLGSQWDVLTDGDIDETELIYADGEVIMLEILG